MTCSSNWQEIQGALLLGQTLQDISDLVARVFMSKLKKMKKMLTTKRILGVLKQYI
jgi:dsRNA-specific ribonuclease